MSPCSGRMTTAVAPEARSVSSGLADASPKPATALAVAVDVRWKVHRVEATTNEFRPPGGQFAGRDRTERGTGLVDGRMPGREAADRVNELFLLDGDRQCHRSSAFEAENAGGVAVQELRPHLVRQWDVGHVAEDPFKRESHRKVT